MRMNHTILVSPQRLGSDLIKPFLHLSWLYKHEIHLNSSAEMLKTSKKLTFLSLLNPSIQMGYGVLLRTKSCGTLLLSHPQAWSRRNTPLPFLSIPTGMVMWSLENMWVLQPTSVWKVWQLTFSTSTSCPVWSQREAGKDVCARILIHIPFCTLPRVPTHYSSQPTSPQTPSLFF